MIEHNHCCGVLCRIIPPHMMDKLLESKDTKYQKMALKTLRFDNFVRMDRATKATDLRIMRDAAVIPEVISEEKKRQVFNAKNTEQLPGDIIREESSGPTPDITINEAFDYLGATYDFYKEKYNRNSIDNYGMVLIATVHFGEKYCNAFWNGSQMVFGDGDGEIFDRFTIDPDIMGHELAHGVTQYSIGLVYQYQSGALNESYSDVFGAMIKQFLL